VGGKRFAIDLVEPIQGRSLGKEGPSQILVKGDGLERQRKPSLIVWEQPTGRKKRGGSLMNERREGGNEERSYSWPPVRRH